MGITFNSPISRLHGVGLAIEKKLNHLGIKKVKDLFFHLPARYDDFSEVTPIRKVKPDDKVTIEGKVLSINIRQIWGRNLVIVTALIGDKTGAIKATWFNQVHVATSLPKDAQVMMSGPVKLDKNGIYLASPSFEIIGDEETDTTHTGRLVPVYPETRGITSRWLRYQIKGNIELLKNLRDWLPENIKKRQKLISLKNALEQMHFPDTKKDAKEATKRLSFDELFILQLFLLKEKTKLQKKKAPKIKFNKATIKKFVSKLPFKLTNAQRLASYEILKDLEKDYPMHRLLEGDVGSGKTIVAAMATLSAIEAGYRVAIMAPTEILAQQHYQEFKKLLPRNKVSLLTGKQKDTTESEIIIGTHALLHTELNNIGLSIIDEQHRFGVRQRAHLAGAHLLSMTATPIPRTLALTVYGDLDLSILDEMPKGRKKIITRVVAPGNRHQSYTFIKSEIKKGRQAFVICPLVEESTALQTKAVKQEYEKLNNEIFPNLKVDYIHGRLKEKQDIMKRFSEKKTNILVSTSVVEVGIDIPNATIMMIEGSERFGLAQLHQLRGRVGRGKDQSYCFLFSDSTAKNTKKRMKAIEEAESGFQLAEEYLKIRGPGQFLGLRQSGFPDISMASLLNARLIKKARKEAELVLPKIEKYPTLKKRLESFQALVHME